MLLARRTDHHVWHTMDGDLTFCGEPGALLIDRVEAGDYIPGDTCLKCQELHKTKPADAINPNHYKSHPSGVECIDIVEHMNFNRGNAMKYLWRAGSKGDVLQEIEDLKKARWYLDREVKRMNYENISKLP